MRFRCSTGQTRAAQRSARDALAGRYGDIERRVLEYFVRNPEERVVFLPGDFDILLMQLLDAGVLQRGSEQHGSVTDRLVAVAPSGEDIDGEPEMIVLRGAHLLTDTGAEYVSAIRDARALH